MKLDDQNLDSKGKDQQLRVRISHQQYIAIEKLIEDKFKGQTLSDIVRTALSLLIESPESAPINLMEKKVRALATLLKRDPVQIEKACIEGVLDLVENKAKVPLIVMESRLYLSYGNPGGDVKLPWEV